MLSQYVDWIINKINGFFFKKKKPKKQQQQKQKRQKRISLEPCTGTTLSKTHNIYIQLYRRSKNDRTTQQLQEHSNFQWDNTTNDHISQVK